MVCFQPARPPRAAKDATTSRKLAACNEPSASLLCLGVDCGVIDTEGEGNRAGAGILIVASWVKWSSRPSEF